MSDSESLPPRRQFRRLAVVACLVLILGACGVLAGIANAGRNLDLTSQSASSAPQSLGDVRSVQLSQGALTFACAPGLVNPLNPTGGGSEVQFLENDGSETVDLNGGGFAVEMTADAIASRPDVPATVFGESTGEQAGLVLQPCIRPTLSSVLPAGSTVIGEDTLLLLSNPSAVPVTARVQILSPIGPLLEVPHDVLVPAYSTVVSVPAIWAPGEARIALQIETDGNEVAAWLQSSGLDGEVPVGISTLPSQNSRESVTIVGLDPETSSSLRIVNLADEATEVAISLLTEDGSIPLGGAEEVTVDGLAVFDIDLGKLPSNTRSLQLESATPIAASILEVRQGEPFSEDEELSLYSRTLLGSVSPISQVNVPGTSDLTAAVQALGFAFESAELFLANPSGEQVVVTVGADQVVLEPGVSRSLAIENPTSQSLEVSGSSTVYATLDLRVSSEVGLVRAVMSLREDATNQIEQDVRVFPAH